MRALQLMLLTGLIACGLGCQASGTYPGSGAPRALAGTDRGLIELGRAIFNGKAKLSDADGNGDTQRERLNSLQAKLPGTVRKSVDLPSLAGRLTAQQLAALEAFLEARFEIKL